jgi:anti-sigma B factor antagonist
MVKHKLAFTAESPDPSTRIYRLSGHLYGTTEGYAFQDQVRQTIADGPKKIVLDLGAVERIDSSGIGILAALMFSAYKAGGAFVLASLPPRIRDLLDMVMLLERMEHADSVEAALARLEEMTLPG